MRRIEFFLPTHFYVKGRRWKIVITDELKYDRVLIKKGPRKGQYKWVRLYGECHPDDRTILISEHATPLQMAKTFLHEYLHALEYEYKIRLPHKMVHFADRRLGYIFMLMMACQSNAAVLPPLVVPRCRRKMACRIELNPSKVNGKSRRKNARQVHRPGRDRRVRKDHSIDAAG